MTGPVNVRSAYDTIHPRKSVSHTVLYRSHPILVVIFIACPPSICISSHTSPDVSGSKKVPAIVARIY